MIEGQVASSVASGPDAEFLKTSLLENDLCFAPRSELERHDAKEDNGGYQPKRHRQRFMHVNGVALRLFATGHELGRQERHGFVARAMAVGIAEAVCGPLQNDDVVGDPNPVERFAHAFAVA